MGVIKTTNNKNTQYIVPKWLILTLTQNKRYTFKISKSHQAASKSHSFQPHLRNETNIQTSSTHPPPNKTTAKRCPFHNHSQNHQNLIFTIEKTPVPGTQKSGPKINPIAPPKIMPDLHPLQKTTATI